MYFNSYFINYASQIFNVSPMAISLKNFFVDCSLLNEKGGEEFDN